MPRQDALPTPNPTNLIEVSFNNNYLDETQDTDFKSIVINFFKKFNVFKDDINFKNIPTNVSLLAKKTQIYSWMK